MAESVPATDRIIGFILYPRFTALDIVGPHEVLSRIPGYRSIWLAESADPVQADTGFAIVPHATFDDAPPLEIFVVPGGPGQTAQMENEAMIAFLKRAGAEARWVVSVCTGSLLLAKAGFLDGKRATTHWLAREVLEKLGAIPVPDRVVADGNVMTGAGVSAGIDLALTLAAELAGETTAQAIQLGIEYDPQPPYDVGAPEKAPAALVQFYRERAREYLE